MVSAVRLIPDKIGDPFREINGIGRRTDLIIDDLQDFILPGKFKDFRHEFFIFFSSTEDPAGIKNIIVIKKFFYLKLTLVLCGAIAVDRIRLIIFDIRSAFSAVIDHPCAYINK